MTNKSDGWEWAMGTIPLLLLFSLYGIKVAFSSALFGAGYVGFVLILVQMTVIPFPVFFITEKIRNNTWAWIVLIFYIVGCMVLTQIASIFCWQKYKETVEQGPPDTTHMSMLLRVCPESALQLQYIAAAWLFILCLVITLRFVVEWQNLRSSTPSS